MQAVIMAGGKGTRLSDLTKDAIPKALVQVQDKPLLDYVIEHTIKNGCDNIIICTGHLAHQIEEHIKSKEYSASILISQEKKLLGTAGPLHLISDLLEEEFFVLYADVYSTINMKKMLDFHFKSKADATIAVHKSSHPHDSTIVKIDEKGKYIEMIQKPGDKWKLYGNITQTSLYLMKKDVLKFIKHDSKQDFETDVFPLMLKNKKSIFGYLTKEYTKDMGTPDRYNKLVNKLQSKSLSK